MRVRIRARFMRDFGSETGKAIQIARGTTCDIWSK
jgi:hypothetical protein